MRTFTTQIKGAEFKIMRLQDAMPVTQPIETPAKSVEYLQGRLSSSLRYNPDTENMVVVLLNTRLRPIGFEVISNGSLDTLLVHPREIFKPAIVLGAAAIILAHNHPSGDPTPSQADIKVTRDLIRAGQILQIEVKDHVILGQISAENPQGWSSLRELNYFYN